jgi:hypothetical protein
MTSDELLKVAQDIFGNLVIDVSDYHEHSGHEGGVDLVADPKDDIADEYGVTLHFENGNRVRFSTSEWAFIQRLDSN